MNNVLFLEEDHAIRSVFSEVLRNEGFVVLEAADTAEAVAACEGYPDPIDLSIIDTNNGMAAVKRLSEVCANTGVLFIGDAESHRRLARAPVLRLAWLEKPFTSGALLNAVHAMLKPEGAHAGQ